MFICILEDFKKHKPWKNKTLDNGPGTVDPTNKTVPIWMTYNMVLSPNTSEGGPPPPEAAGGSTPPGGKWSTAVAWGGATPPAKCGGA